MPALSHALLLLPALAWGEMARDLILEGGGATHEVRDGGTVRIGGADYRVRVAATQTFTAERLSFRVPSDFALETGHDEGVASYVLDGNNVVVSLYVPPQGTAAAPFIAQLQDGIAQSLKIRRKAVEPAAEITLAGAQVEGTRLLMPVGSVRIHIDFYALRHQDQDLVLTIQHGEDAADVQEYETVVGLLRTTFRYLGP